MKYGFAFIATILVALLLTLLVGECSQGQYYQQSPCYTDPYTGQRVCPQQRQPVYQQPVQQQPINAQPAIQADRNALHSTPPGPMDVGIEVSMGQTAEGLATAMGSGALVARSASGGTIALTNWHVGSSGTANVILSDGRRVQGRIVATDQQNDLSAIDIPVALQYTSIANQSPAGVRVTIRAFDNGINFRKYEGTTGQGNTLLDTYSVGGNSGSGVYYQGRLVGILWGNRANRLAYAGVGPIRALLDRIRARYTVCEVSVTAQQTQQADPGPQQSVATPLPNASCNCVEKFKAILARQDKLETDIRGVTTNIDAKIDARIEAKLALVKLPERGEKGERGAQGERGPQGIQGEQGPPGKDANTTNLEQRIAELENRKIKLEIYRDGELVGVSEGKSIVRVNIKQLEESLQSNKEN